MKGPARDSNIPLSPRLSPETLIAHSSSGTLDAISYLNLTAALVLDAGG